MQLYSLGYWLIKDRELVLLEIAKPKTKVSLPKLETIITFPLFSLKHSTSSCDWLTFTCYALHDPYSHLQPKKQSQDT
jgi:hypothetical protein